MSRLALFRCDATTVIGGGHVVRCLTLADALKLRGWRCEFYCVAGSADIVPRLRDEIHYNLPEHVAGDPGLITGAPADLIVFDHYGLDAAYEQVVRRYHDRAVVAILDDLADRIHDADVLLDQTPGRLPQEYAPYVPESCCVLTGPGYALLRPQFLAQRQVALERRTGRIERVLVSLGNTDAGNITGLVLDAAERMDGNLAWDIVIGGGSPHRDGLAARIEALVHAGKNVRAHIHVQDMAGLMAQADIAIGAGGTTSWERCCLGLPTVMIEIADNQKKIAATLDDMGCAVNLGWHQAVGAQDIAEMLNALCLDPGRVLDMSRRAAFLCGGRGVDAFIPYLVAPESGDVTLRLMTADDSETLFAWQSYPETRRYSRTPDAPSREEHERWMARALSDADRQLYMILCHGRPAGMIRLDRLAEGSPQGFAPDPARAHEISILLDPAFYGKGLASAALRLVRKLEPGAVFWAEAHPDNKASRRLFERVNFTTVNDHWFRQAGEQA